MRRVRFFVLAAAACFLAALPSQAPRPAGAASAGECEACYSAYTACMEQGYGYGVCCPAYNACLSVGSLCAYCPEWQDDIQ